MATRSKKIKPIRFEPYTKIRGTKKLARKGTGPVSPIPVGHTEKTLDYNQRTMQCGSIDGKYYVVNLKYMEQGLIEWNNDEPIINGIYTWVLFKGNDENMLYITKVITAFEIGTKHSDIIHNFIKQNKIPSPKNEGEEVVFDLLFAGEMKITKSSIFPGKQDILFNLESGTYMGKKLTRKNTDILASYQDANSKLDVIIDENYFNLIQPDRELIDADIESKKDKIPQDMDIRRERNSFITHKKMGLKYEHLLNYIENGARIYEYDSLDECNSNINTNAGKKIEAKHFIFNEADGTVIKKPDTSVAKMETSGGTRSKRKTKHKKKYGKKTRKRVRRTKLRGGKYKEIWCSQSIVNLPRMECLKKNCTGTKKYKDNVKKLAKLNKQYDTMVSKKCNIKMSPGKYAELTPETDEQWDCFRSQRKDKLYKTILKLENETNTHKCEKKHCGKLNYMDDCMDLGEEECRKKYKNVIEKQKQKILPLEKCLEYQNI